MYMDESRLLKARAFIPVLDLDFAVEMRSRIDRVPISDLVASLDEVESAIGHVSPSVSSEDADAVARALHDKEQIEAELCHGEDGDVERAERVTSKLADLKARVRDLDLKYGARAAHQETVADIRKAEGLAHQFRDEVSLAALVDLRRDADHCLRLDDERGLRSVRQRAVDIFWKHYPRTDACWTGLVEYLRENRAFASDPIAYHEHLRRAEECLQRSDTEGVRTFGLKAWEYLPTDEARRNRFYDAGLR
jgi:hypothetical protein